jgi:hypothetical protein
MSTPGYSTVGPSKQLAFINTRSNALRTCVGARKRPLLRILGNDSPHACAALSGQPRTPKGRALCVPS